MAKRYLPSEPGEQHERERTDRGEKNLCRKIKLEGRGDEWKDRERKQEHDDAHELEPRPDQREILRIVGAEIAARARLARHDRAPHACRIGPRVATTAWQ